LEDVSFIERPGMAGVESGGGDRKSANLGPVGSAAEARLKDPYEVLGVARTATPEEIRKAYRQLAKKLHPDLNPGDKHAEERFKEVSAANDLLSDPEKRRRFDAGEIDASGAEKAPPQGRYYREYAGAAGHPYESAGGYADFTEGDDLFAELLRRSREQARRAPGPDLHYELHVPFLDAVNGATKTITLPRGGTLDVAIPAGVEDGQILRLRGKGAPSAGEGPPGDALVQIVVEPHRYFTREGDDIHVELPITLNEAALGAEVRAPTTTGSVMLRVPKGSSSGDTLRLKGKGVRARGRTGDEFVTLKVVMPKPPDAELEAFLKSWTPPASYDPRKEM
jgi:DnaJ-class molecular chaperone